MDGIYDTVITAHRNLVRQFVWLDENDDPVDLVDYTRLIYNLQTDELVPVEILQVDTEDIENPEYADWLFIETPSTDGTIKLEVPASALVWTPSSTGRWIHELLLIDDNGGAITLVKGNVLYKKPIVIYT